MYSSVPNNEGGGGGPTDNLNIKKREIQIKKGGGGSEKCQKWQPIITNYGCPKQNFFPPSRYS